MSDNVMILVGGKDAAEKLEKIIFEHRDSEITVISDRENAQHIGKLIGLLRSKVPRINYYVFNEKSPEENALKLFVLNKPGIIIVIGNSKPIEYILRIARKTNIQKVVS
ncbi:MAG: hypothetical protein GXO43_03655 [Crenarchaeota archaeon]|nr:hypothetical protein [Thermoproteota archaeon]